MRDLTMFGTYEAFLASESASINAEFDQKLAHLAEKRDAQGASLADPWIMEITAAARDRKLAEIATAAKKQWTEYLKSEEARILDDCRRVVSQYPSLKGKRIEFGRDGSFKVARIRGPHEKVAL